MLGKKHKLSYNKQISIRMKAAWKDPKSSYNSKETKKKRSMAQSKIMIERLRISPSTIYSRTQKGWREFSGGKRYYFRSKWEMNIAKYFDWLKLKGEILEWEYESETFWFDNIKRGVRSYTPDFKITERNNSQHFVEVKGWMDSKSQTKLKRMAKYYPKVKINLYDEDVYKTLKRQIGALCGWE